MKATKKNYRTKLRPRRHHFIHAVVISSFFIVAITVAVATVYFNDTSSFASSSSTPPYPGSFTPPSTSAPSSTPPQAVALDRTYLNGVDTKFSYSFSTSSTWHAALGVPFSQAYQTTALMYPSANKVTVTPTLAPSTSMQLPWLWFRVVPEPALKDKNGKILPPKITSTGYADTLKTGTTKPSWSKTSIFEVALTQQMADRWVTVITHVSNQDGVSALGLTNDIDDFSFIQFRVKSSPGDLTITWSTNSPEGVQVIGKSQPIAKIKVTRGQQKEKNPTGTPFGFSLKMQSTFAPANITLSKNTPITVKSIPLQGEAPNYFVYVPFGPVDPGNNFTLTLRANTTAAKAGDTLALSADSFKVETGDTELYGTYTIPALSSRTLNY